MKLGFVTAILPDLPLAEVAQFASATGYDCIEVMCWPPSKADRRYAGITHIDVTDFSADDAAKVQDTIATPVFPLARWATTPIRCRPVRRPRPVWHT